MTKSQMQTGSFKMGLHEAVGDGGHLRSGVWHGWTHDSWSSELHHCVNLSGDAMLKSFLPHWRWKQPPDWLVVVPGGFSLSSGAIGCKEGAFFGFYHVAMVTCSFSCVCKYSPTTESFHFHMLASAGTTLSLKGNFLHFQLHYSLENSCRVFEVHWHSDYVCLFFLATGGCRRLQTCL